MNVPHFSLDLDQVRDSQLLSPERMAAVEAEIERRISTPVLPDGRPILNARVADCGEYGLQLYPRMDHEVNWDYMRRALLGVVLTETERELLDRSALYAASRRREEEKLAKAAKVPEAEWDGRVYYGDKHYDNVGECIEDVAGDGGKIPLHVWPAVPRTVVGPLRVSDVVENDLDTNGFEDMDLYDLEGVDELQRALDAFTDANKEVVAFWPDESRAIVVDQEAARKQVGDME